MKRGWKFYVYFLLVLAETFVLFWFSFLPAMDFVRTGLPFLRLGDFEHLAAYALYGFLLHGFFWYFKKFRRGRDVVLFSIVLGSLVGGLCEIMQYFLPYRVEDAVDWGVDTAGSFAGAVLSSKFKSKFKPSFK